MKRLLIILALPVIIAAAYLTFAGPILYRSKVEDACCGITRFVLLNPFRDRSREVVAEQLLAAMKEGHCTEIVATMPLSDERRKLICREESRLHYVTWRLKDREDQNAQQSKLFYLRWSTGESIPSAAWIDLKEQNREWQVVGFNPVY
jgi:hypothetical protein